MRINVEQGSQDWHDLRSIKIGASDAPIIMGDSPWTTKETLYKRKMGLEGPQFVTQAMRRGIELEPEVRSMVSKEIGIELKPAVFVSDKHPWLMASVDGICDDNRICVEIKCPGIEDHELAKRGVVPRKYYAQCQQIMKVIDLTDMFYVSYYEGEKICLKVEKNNEYIETLILKTREFYQELIQFTPPATTQKTTISEFVLMESEEYELTARLLKEKRLQKERLDEECEQLKASLIRICNGKNCYGAGIKIQKRTRRGNVDYVNIPELQGVDLEKHRKPDIEYWDVKNYECDTTASI